MKVVDLQIFRRRKELELLERKLNEQSSAREIKYAFKEWLQRRAQ